jgi:DNA-binding NarL/FixJ family response regulator
VSERTPDTIDVLLVDDQRLLREGLRTLLELHPDLHVVGEATDGIDAEEQVGQLRPNVVLMDLRMPHRDGVAATARIHQRFPATHVLVLTTFDDDELVFRSIESGACGYLLKDVGSDVLAHAVRAAARGDSPLQPSIARKLLKRLRQPLEPAAVPLEGETFTTRDRDVLRRLAEGATNRDIADDLALTEGTVKNYISALLAKTGLHDRTQLALYAARYGFSGHRLSSHRVDADRAPG